MRYILIFLITIYQLFLSPIFTIVLGAQCRYEETCSMYAKRMIGTYGIIRGTPLALKRLLSCQPFAKIAIHAKS